MSEKRLREKQGSWFSLVVVVVFGSTQDDDVRKGSLRRW
jgi:hypothetical protein